MPGRLCHDMGMISPWLAIIATLAAARVTRAITRDSLTQPLRTRVVNRLGIDSRLSELLQCDWCTGFWVALLTVGAAWQWGDHGWVQALLAGLAAAHVIGWLATKEGE